VLIGSGDQAAGLPEGWRYEAPSLEEMVLGYLREPGISAPPRLEEVTAMAVNTAVEPTAAAVAPVPWRKQMRSALASFGLDS
jgi:hypothetical protein